MRRLQRLRGSASSLPTCSAPSARTSPAAAGLLKNELVVSSSNTHHLSARRTHLWQSSLSTQRRYLSTSAPRLAKSEVAIVETPEYSEDEEPAEFKVQTDLAYPAELRPVPRPDEVTDPSYVPATTADGLEEVGGLEGWWDNPEHWGPSKDYVGFGARDKVTDPAVLEVLTKQAVVEALALAVHIKGSIFKATRLMLDYGSEDMATLVNTEIVAGPDGAAALNTEKRVRKVAEFIRRREQAIRRADEAQEASIGPYTPSPEEAREMIKAWGPSWKSTQLRDPFVRFYVSCTGLVIICAKRLTETQTVKRIQKLTGHIIPDGKLVAMKTIGSFISHVITPPKAKKLAEEIQTRGELLDLPNVHVYERRITPVDKENMVGRWKIIEAELQKRGLPVLGTGGYRKAVEKSWLKGGV